MQVQCKDCPNKFEITEGEVDFYKDKGLAVPKRCVPCRKAKRERNEGNRPFQGKLHAFKGGRKS